MTLSYMRYSKTMISLSILNLGKHDEYIHWIICYGDLSFFQTQKINYAECCQVHKTQKSFLIAELIKASKSRRLFAYCFWLNMEIAYMIVDLCYAIWYLSLGKLYFEREMQKHK